LSSFSKPPASALAIRSWRKILVRC
jgi:hypothetical protein